MKILITILFILCFGASFSQTTFPLAQKLGNKDTKVFTDGALATSTGFIWSLSFADTTAANAEPYLKYTPGIIIRINTNELWVRNFNSTAWVQVGSGGGGGTVTGGLNGLSASLPNIILGGSALDRYTAIGLNGFPLSFVHNGVNTAAQSDSNSIRLTNNTVATAITDSLVSPAILQNVTSKRAIGTAQTVSFRTDVVGTGGISGATAIYRIRSSVAGAAYTNMFRITSSGVIPDLLNLNGNQIGTATSPGTQSANLRFGLGSADALTTGAFNIAIGVDALTTVSAGNYNVAIGSQALAANDSSFNSAYGVNSLRFNTVGEQNSGFGYNSLLSNTTGIKNTGLGAAAFESLTTGRFNSAFGHDAAFQMVTGDYNVFGGWLSGSGLASGDRNTALGESTMRSITGGSRNVFIGNQAGYLGGQLAVIHNSIALGADAHTYQSYQMVLGNDSTTQTILKGIAAGGLTTDSVVVSLNGVLRKVAQSDLAAANIYNSNGTVSGDRAVTIGTNDLDFVGSNTELLLDEANSRVLLSSSNSIQLIATGFVSMTNPATSNDTTTRKILVYNTSTNHIEKSNWGNSTPTFQQVLTKGSTLTSAGSNNVNINGGTFTLSNGVISLQGGTSIFVDAQDLEYTNLPNRATQDRLLGMISSTGATGYVTIGAGLSLSSGSLSATGGAVTWNGITNPTGTQTLSFDDAELTAWTNGSNTETFWTIDNNSLTTGVGHLSQSNSLTSGTLTRYISTSTTLAANNELLDLAMSGANGTSSITATAARISVTNTGTTNTNIGLDVTASGGSTDNWAIASTGNIRLTSANTTQATTSSAFYLNPSALTTGTGMYSTTATQTSGNLIQLTGTSTTLSANNELLDISLSGANGTNAITATGARISVVNTNATSGTNIGLDITASGATTANIAVQATGSINVTGAGTFSSTLTASSFQTSASAANSNFNTGAGTGNASSASATYQFGGSTTVGYRVGVNGTTNSTLGVGWSAASFISAGSGYTEAGSGTQPILTNAAFIHPIMVNGAGATTDLTTVYIDGRGLGITPTNAATSLWVDAGIARIDDTLAVGTAAPLSKLDVVGSVGYNITSTNTDITLDVTYYTVKVDASGANRTITLPAASGCTRRIYVIKKTDSSGNTVTIDGNASETIDGVTTKVLSTQYAGYAIQSDGTGWNIVSAF